MIVQVARPIGAVEEVKVITFTPGAALLVGPRVVRPEPPPRQVGLAGFGIIERTVRFAANNRVRTHERPHDEADHDPRHFVVSLAVISTHAFASSRRRSEPVRFSDPVSAIRRPKANAASSALPGGRVSRSLMPVYTANVARTQDHASRFVAEWSTPAAAHRVRSVGSAGSSRDREGAPG